MLSHTVSFAWGRASRRRAACDMGIRMSLAPHSTDTGPS